MRVGREGRGEGRERGTPCRSNERRRRGLLSDGRAAAGVSVGLGLLLVLMLMQHVVVGRNKKGKQMKERGKGGREGDRNEPGRRGRGNDFAMCVEQEIGGQGGRVVFTHGCSAAVLFG